MHAEPVAPQEIPRLCARLIASAGTGRRRLCVAIDGAPATLPARLADDVAGLVRVMGRPAVRVSAADFLRPASVRLEHGRHDPQTYRSDWVDAAALRREVLEPFGSTGRYLPTLWDPTRDRATRARALDAASGAVLLVDGTLLLDKGLPFDLTVHLWLSPAALARQTDPALEWTLPAYQGYPGAANADAVIRFDDPRHPAVVGD